MIDPDWIPIIVAYCAVTAVFSYVVQAARPRWSASAVAFLTSSLLPMTAVIFSAIILIRVRCCYEPPAGDIDSMQYVMMLPIIIVMLALLCFVAGLVSAYVTIWIARRG